MIPPDMRSDGIPIVARYDFIRFGAVAIAINYIAIKREGLVVRVY